MRVALLATLKLSPNNALTRSSERCFQQTNAVTSRHSSPPHGEVRGKCAVADQISWLGFFLGPAFPVVGDQWHRRPSSPSQSRGGGSIALRFPEICNRREAYFAPAVKSYRLHVKYRLNRFCQQFRSTAIQRILLAAGSRNLVETGETRSPLVADTTRVGATANTQGKQAYGLRCSRLVARELTPPGMVI